MKRYDEYKDSSVEWIGEIPEHWKVIKIRYVASRVETGKTPPTKNPEYFDGDVDWFTPGDYKGSIVLQSSDKKISELAVNELDLKIYPPETVLLVGIGATLGKVGMTVNSAFSNQQINAIIFDKQKLNPLFGTYFLNSQKKRIVSSSNSATLSILNQSKTKDFELLCPPLEEQQHIAAYLDRRTAQIDDLISKKRRMIALLQEERAAVINRAVTKGLDPAVRMKDSGVEWIGEVPEHWEIVKLRWLIHGKLKYGANETTGLTDRSLPRYIRITDFDEDGSLREETFRALEKEIAENYLLDEGDILFARSGATVGKTFQFKNYEGEACFAGYLIKASPNQDVMKSDYLYYFTKSSAYENWKDSIFIQATIQNIGADKYQNLVVPVPSPEEQGEILEFLDEKTSQIDTTISQAEKQIELLQEYRTALISEVVTGKVDVRDEGVAG